MSALSKGNLFDPKLVNDLIVKAKGHSTLATLAPQTPVAFVGNKYFTFELDKEIDVVAENGAKSQGTGVVDPVTMIPVKVEYGMRVSDEFKYASEEEQLTYLEAFNEAFAKKLAKGLDIMAMHGLNPRTGNASSVIGNNNFDSKVTTNSVEYDPAHPDTSIESAIALVEAQDMDVTGIAITPAVRNDLAQMKNSTNDKLYPEFAFGGKPSNLGANQLDINKTVGTGAVDTAIVGDFANMFKWGYGKEVSFEVIEYGNPDNSNDGDLKGHNQVYLRAEAYIAWAIFDEKAFARIVPATDDDEE